MQITARDQDGVLIQSEPMFLGGYSHQAFALGDWLPRARAKVGTIEFKKSGTAGSLSGLGLRFSPTGSFTSVQTLSGGPGWAGGGSDAGSTPGAGGGDTGSYVPGSGSFALKIYEGYRLSDKMLLKSDDKTADICFYPRTVYYVPTGYLGATRIKEFSARPDLAAITAAEVDKWEDYIAAPATGNYYLIRGVSGGYYLLKLENFENQGAGTSYWKVNFSWEAVQIGK